MSKRIIEYGRPKAQKNKAFLDSCERLIKEKGALHKSDLINQATNKKGMPMRCSVPVLKGVFRCLSADKQKRFIHVGDGVWDLAHKEVEA